MRNLLRLPAFLLVLASFPYMARADTMARAGALTGLDAMTSTVLQKGQSSFSGIAVRLRIHPAAMTQSFEILPSIEYWRNSNTIQPYDIHSSRRDATLGVDARFRFQHEGWAPFVGAGLGIHFLSNEVDAPVLGVQDAQTSSVRGGLAVLGGVTFPMTQRIDNFLELKYHMLSGSEQLKLSWGLAVGF